MNHRKYFNTGQPIKTKTRLSLTTKGEMMGALVLKKFHVDIEAQGTEEAVHVIGRQPGIMGFLMSIAGIDPNTEIKCNDERIEVVSSSFFGTQSICIPIAAVTSIVGGHTKPKSYLLGILPVFIFGGSLAGATQSALPFALAVVVAAFMFVMYLLKKEMSLYAQNGGDVLWGLTFKRSVIEGVTVDSDMVNEAIYAMNQRVIAIHKKK